MSVTVMPGEETLAMENAAFSPFVMGQGHLYCPWKVEVDVEAFPRMLPSR